MVDRHGRVVAQHIGVVAVAVDAVHRGGMVGDFAMHRGGVGDGGAEEVGRAGEDHELLAIAEDGEAFILHPGEFVLASTYEVITLPDDIAGRLEGKSSLGRLGLLTHSTAGFIDPGFSGHITLELSNVANLPVKLYPGMKIGQLCLIKLSSPAEHPYGSAQYLNRYQGQRGPTASRSFMNFHRSIIK